jgi:hypothetical protein
VTATGQSAGVVGAGTEDSFSSIERLAKKNTIFAFVVRVTELSHLNGQENLDFFAFASTR